MPGTASFDVFETCLIRAVGEPSSVFTLMGRKLYREGVIGHDSYTFATARIAAEQRARKRNPRIDTSIDRIAAELAHGLGLSAACAHRILDEEMELESSLLRANPAMFECVRNRRRAGCRIIFVSDSYLPAKFIEQQLQVRGFFRDGDGLFVSSDWGGMNKKSGALYKLVLETEQLKRGHISHVGNHPISDVTQARSNGIKPRHFTEGNLNRYERCLEQHGSQTGGLSSVLAGSSRLARLQYAYPSPHLRCIRDVTAGVAGPLLASYVLWLLHRTNRQGLQRLYFLAREGKVLLRLAERLAPKLGVQCELRYLHVSRQSLNIAALGDDPTETLDLVLTNVETNTVRTILGRLNLDPDDVTGELARAGFLETDLDVVPSLDVWRSLRRALLQGELRCRLGEAYRARRAVICQYLEQEGYFDNLPVGTVDTTGAGSQLWALDQLRSAQGVKVSEHFLMYRKAPTERTAERSIEADVQAWLEDEPRELGWGPPPGRAVLAEIFTAADHGTVLTYHRASDSRVEPVLAPGFVGELEEWGLDALHETLMAFADALYLDSEYVDVQADTRKAVIDVMNHFWEAPSRREAVVWGAFPFEGASGQERTAKPLASPLSLGDLLPSRLKPPTLGRPWFNWRQASERISAAPVRAVLPVKLLANRCVAALRCRLQNFAGK